MIKAFTLHKSKRKISSLLRMDPMCIPILWFIFSSFQNILDNNHGTILDDSVLRFGFVWTILAFLGLFQAVLDHYGLFRSFWTVLSHVRRFGPFQTFWTPFDYFWVPGSFWAILVFSGTILDHMRLFQALWGHFEAIQNHFGSFSDILANLGHFASFPDYDWPFWTFSDHYVPFGLFDVILGHFGPCLAILNCFGAFQIILSLFRPFEIILEPVLTILGHYRPFWSISDHS
jgi:hypothetical protein